MGTHLSADTSPIQCSLIEDNEFVGKVLIILPQCLVSLLTQIIVIDKMLKVMFSLIFATSGRITRSKI